jgi:hypothetical protein
MAALSTTCSTPSLCVFGFSSFVQSCNLVKSRPHDHGSRSGMAGRVGMVPQLTVGWMMGDCRGSWSWEEEDEKHASLQLEKGASPRWAIAYCVLM